MALSPRARRAQTRYAPSAEELAMREHMQPIPRAAYDEYSDEELGEEIKRLFVLKRAEMAPRIALDMRLLKWYDPQKLSDTWQDARTGRLIPKLFHSTGLALIDVPWSGAIVEGMVGLLAGNKPMAYLYDVEPEDPDSDADVIQSDLIEEYLDRWVDQTDYDITYLDKMTDVVELGRCWSQVTTDADTYEINSEVLWPGYVTAFWQQDHRTVEQVTVEAQLTLSEALNLYATSPERRDMIEAAVRAPSSAGQEPWLADRLTGSRDQNISAVTVLTHWYRRGVGKYGVDPATLDDERPTRQIGMCAVLLYDKPDSEYGTFLLAREGETGYEDIPVHCTPRFKPSRSNPDEAYGVLARVAGLHTQYNEVFSAFRDMLWRAIYARYVAKGFTFRNSPKLIPGSAIYALPRTDQGFERIREEVNTAPIEQFLTHLEELIIVLSGLNRYFLGSAPPSETSGESINAAINASITQLQPVRSNIQRGEEWTYEQVLAQSEAFVVLRYRGRTTSMASIIEGRRSVSITWRDVTPKDAEKAKRAAIEGVNAGFISRDTGMEEYNVHNKTSEKRKIRQERQDPVWSPQTVTMTAQAMLQKAMAERQIKALAMTPLAPMQPGAEQGAPGGAGGPPTPDQSETTARTAQASAAPRQGTQSNNAKQGAGTSGGRAARGLARPAQGQQPKNGGRY